jgi:phage head maturation protease
VHDDTEILVNFGGSIKSRDSGYGGHGVIFGNPDSTDASDKRDYFEKDTYFRLDFGDKSPVYYNHGVDEKFGTKIIGEATMKSDDVGVWMDIQLKMRDDYEKAIEAMIKSGKLGISTGTASHLVKRQKQANGSNKIMEWPLGMDVSLTPTPAEPRTYVTSLKSLIVDDNENYLAQRIHETKLMMGELSHAINHRKHVRQAKYRTLSEPDSKSITEYIDYISKYMQSLDDCVKSVLFSDVTRPPLEAEPVLASDQATEIKRLRHEYDKLRLRMPQTCQRQQPQESGTSTP